MKGQVARWGDGLGVRIPEELADQAGLSEGSRVEIELANDRIVISRGVPHYRLEDLLQGMTPEAASAAFDWGRDEGRESVDE